MVFFSPENDLFLMSLCLKLALYESEKPSVKSQVSKGISLGSGAVIV